LEDENYLKNFSNLYKEIKLFNNKIKIKNENENENENEIKNKNLKENVNKNPIKKNSGKISK
jgi:hypothetical protein